MYRLSLFTALFLLTACGSEQAPSEGSTALAHSDAPLPAGFTPYPGAEELSRTSISQDGQSYTLLSLQADASPETLVAYYRQQAEAAGIPISLEASNNGMHQIGGESSTGLNFSFTARQAGAQTSATLAIGQSGAQPASQGAQ